MGKDDIYFPEKGQARIAAEAKKICRGCPVQQPCRQYAVEQKTEYGVWGGHLYQPQNRVAPPD